MRTNSYAAACGMLLVSAVLLGVHCSDGPSGPEDDPPVIEILFPTGGAHDRDGDGLVDIEIAFRDTDSSLDPQTLQIESSRRLGPSGVGGVDLLTSFNIVERDSLHIVLEETSKALLPNGNFELRVTVSDRAGNTSTIASQLSLPAGAFHTFMQSPVPGRFPVGIEVVPAGPGGRPLGVLLSDSELIPFDTESLTFADPIPLAFVHSPIDGEWNPSTGRLFIVSSLSPDLLPFDPVNLVIESPTLISARAIGISRDLSDLLYLALSTTPASFSVVDPVIREEIAVFQTEITDPLNPSEAAFIRTPRVPSSKDVVYIPLGVDPGGLLVVDAATGQVLRHLDLSPNSPGLGFVVETAFNRNTGLLYASELSHPGGLTVFDTNSESVVARTLREGVGGKFPTLSPSGRRVFLSLAANPPAQAENWFLDATSYELLERIPVEGIGSAGSNASAFRPDGQLVFVASGNGVAVYLNRE